MYTFTLKGSTLDQKIGTYIRDNKEYIERKKWTFDSEDDREAHEKQISKKYNTTYLDMLDSLHDALQIIDNKLVEDLLKDAREVLASHFTAILSQQSDLENEPANATLDNPKERILLNFYFDKIHPKVMRTEDPNGNTEASSMQQLSTVAASDASTLNSTSLGADRRSAVWLALMFRLWSWLFLHDFKDNRLPVYIT